jgi:hypothetical protein
MIAPRSVLSHFVPATEPVTPAVAAMVNAGPVTLADRVIAACRRLQGSGWAALFQQHGLDLGAADLRAELFRTLPAIDRTAPGFEDFALEGCRGIEPGHPARSLVFHAFASPQVTRLSSGAALADFPTPGEIEAVENFVYGAEPPSVEDLRARVGDAHLAIIVVSAEYRPAVATVHRKHADMCFARTGVARVGTASAEYLGGARGYLPFNAGAETSLRVLPCRYAAYIAALLPGDKGGHGPMRFVEDDVRPSTATTARRKDAGIGEPPSALRRHVPDGKRNFWVPLHKLFDGDECLRGKTLHVRLAASHTNEKLRRTHLRFLAGGHHAGWTEPDLSKAPFIFHDGIAELSTDARDGSWLLTPVVHARLIEPAVYAGAPLTYLVPPSDPERAAHWGTYRSSLNLPAQPSGARTAPEYVHARHAIDVDGTPFDLNARPDMIAAIKKGGYRAQHYLDRTGDGWIDVECSALALDIPRRLPAYSMVASPDFFPLVHQTDLMQWTDQSIQPAMLALLWSAPGAGRPQALSDQRYAANLELAGAGFDPADDTMTAIVGSFGSGDGRLTRLEPLDLAHRRASMLPDSAAGVFAPGWDVSYDRTPESDVSDTGDTVTPGTTFLNNYGLGSPFVEDAMLCAALSSFWPAVAPDVTRTFEPGRSYATATPLTDETIGLGAKPPWDGIEPPVFDPVARTVEYHALAYGDYVRTALAQEFNVHNIGLVSAPEYFARTLTMALVYEALAVATHDDKLLWSILSFAPAAPADPVLQDALVKTGRTISGQYLYRYEVYRHERAGAKPHPDPAKFDKLVVAVQETVVLFADPSIVFKQVSGGGWDVHELRR